MLQRIEPVGGRAATGCSAIAATAAITTTASAWRSENGLRGFVIQKKAAAMPNARSSCPDRAPG